MSRRLKPSSHSRTSSLADNNPHKSKTLPPTCIHQRVPSTHRHHYHQNQTDQSDDTFTDSHSHYECRERSFSENSISPRLQFYDDDSRRTRYYSSNRKIKDKINPHVHKDRRVYPQYAPVDSPVYQEISSQAIPENPSTTKSTRLSDRPHSALSSGVTSAVGDGCGGKCPTFENVCYFILQLIFMMCILIGVSLCIAGLVLRKSAARNLQVLVYIGALVGIVSGLLLGIQWNARNSAKKRKLASRNAKRAPIPLETLMPRSQQPLIAVQEGQRVVIPHNIKNSSTQFDEQGIPWWRRKDLV